MAKLGVVDVQIFKKMMNDHKAEFNKKREETKGSCERMKYYAQKCVQADNEAKKRKALGRPGIDPKLAAKKTRSLLKLIPMLQGRDNRALSSLPA